MRLGQVVNGQAITYTLDLAAPLVTVLTEAQLNKRVTHLYGLGDSPLAEDDGAAWTYLSGRDALNSVRQETDAAGRVLTARSFDPYGVPLSGEGGAPFGYAGEYRDSYIKLQWLRARWLDNETGRFISPDTILPDPVNPATLNAYIWVLNNPVRYVDPSGHQGVLPWPDPWQQVWQWIEQVGVAAAPVAVAAGPEAVAGAGIATVCVGVPAVALIGFASSDPNDPNYLLPEEYQAGRISTTYPLAGTTTLRTAGTPSGTLLLAKGDRGVRTTAEHLAMLLGGGKVGGFGPHPGDPDPSGRDRNKNTKGLRQGLEEMTKGIRKGESLQEFLARQGLSEGDARQFVREMQNYLEHVLPSDVESMGISEELAQDIATYAKQLGIQ